MPPVSKIIKNDPFLRAFCVDANSKVFDVSGFFTPISIKDQLIRSCWLIEKSFNLGIISKNTNLLIVGAGPSGVAAAITARNKGLKNITIIERSKAVGSILQTTSRNIDFVQYDWASEHWNKGVFPLDKTKNPIPFVLESDEPSKSIKIIEDSLLAADITPYFGIEVEKPTFNRGRVQINFKSIISNSNGGTPKTTEFDMALSCVGFGSEIVQIKKSKFRGYKFWELNNHSEYAKNFEQNILISGGGDGSLQDFLLLATKKQTAKDIYNALRIPAALKKEIEKTIFEVEERLKRKEVWLNKNSPNFQTESCELYGNLQKIHKEQVVKALSNSKVQKNLEKMLTKLVINGNLKLAFSCNHFSACYPLNRFLVILIEQYLKENKAINPFLSNYRIEKIESSDKKLHICNFNEAECAEYNHTVSFKHQCKCDFKANSTCVCKTKPHKDIKANFDKIVVRFGIGKITPAFGKPPALPGMQILPYSLPESEI